MTWLRNGIEVEIGELATEHILNALSYIDERRTELSRELAEINAKAKEMKRIVQSREKRK